VVELHTGRYCDAGTEERVAHELDALVQGAGLAVRLGLRVHAGHGLRIDNVGPVAAIEAVEEMSIGHSIIGRALQVGIEEAVYEMLEALRV